MKKQPLLTRFLYKMRDLRSGELFASLQKHCNGSVLDVGGWDFYLSAIRNKVPFTAWTVVEPTLDKITPPSDDRVRILAGDGCKLDFQDNQFDTVISIQVLEHVFDPNKMFAELVRVLKPGGKGIIMVPQTGTIHMIPDHYYNFTKFWCEKAAEKNHVRILDLKAMGGFWSTIASRQFFFFFQTFRCNGFSSAEFKRNMLFYILFPFMVIFVCLSIPICLFFSLGDLSEEPNNHLMVIQK